MNMSFRKEFVEKYDLAAMESIDRISKDYGLNMQRHTIKGVSFKEGFEKFLEYADGYASYKINTVFKEQNVTHEVLMEKSEIFIRDRIFEETAILYKDIPNNINSYIDGMVHVDETIESLKANMVDGGVDVDSITSLNKLSETFITKVNESFNIFIETVLGASGYNFGKRIYGDKNRKDVISDPIFL